MRGAERRASQLAYAQLHAQLTAELKFRLAAIDVRAPGDPARRQPRQRARLRRRDERRHGAGLAGAIIRFLGSVWPSPRQFLLRIWVEPQPQPQPPPPPQSWPAGDCKVNPSTWRTRATATRSRPRRWPARMPTRRPRGWRLRRQADLRQRSRHAAVVLRPCGPRRPRRAAARQAGADPGGNTGRRPGLAGTAQIAKLQPWASGAKAAGVPGTSSPSSLTSRAITWAHCCLHARNLG